MIKKPERKGFIKGVLVTIGGIALAAGAGYFGLKYKWAHEKNRYSDGFADFGDGKIIYDQDLAKFVEEHLKPTDRLDVHKIVDASVLGFSILEGGVDTSDYEEDWKF